MTTIRDVLALPVVPYGERRALPNSPGIYFAVINDEILAYVGSTVSLRSRWRCHNKRVELLAMGRVRVHYLTCSEDFFANFVEQDVIEVFRPPLNLAPARYGVRPDPGTWLPAALTCLLTTPPRRPPSSGALTRPASWRHSAPCTGSSSTCSARP